MGLDKTSRVLRQMSKSRPQVMTPVASDMFLPNINAKRTPKRKGDLVNKKYFDENASGLPSGVQGDIFYHNGTAWVVLNAGTSGLFLKTFGAGANPAWAAPAGSGDMTKAEYDADDNGLVDHSESVLGECRKGSVGTIAIGSPVYISGYNVAGWVEVEEADADDPTKMPAVGLAHSALTNSSTGTFMHNGSLNFDTSSWSVGDEVFVSSTAGTLTNTKPTGTAAIQKMGIVMRSHAVNGFLGVFGAGRSNDVPNIPSAQLWVGNASAVATPVTMSGDATMSNAGAVTIANDHVQGTDTTLGTGCVAADHGTASTDQVVNVCYGTSATPPTASTTTEGTLYIQYTA